MASQYASSPVEQPADQALIWASAGFPARIAGFENAKCFRIAEEIRHADQQIAKKCFDFGACILQKTVILFDRFNLVNGQQTLNAR